MKEEKWTVLSTLRHARHDWMNDIQLVKAYLALGKVEDAMRAVDQATLKAAQESKLCNLGMPGMAELLLTFNWSTHAFRLEYEVEEYTQRVRANDGKAIRFFQTCFSLLEAHITEYTHHSLFIRLVEENSLLTAQLDWDGPLVNKAHFMKVLNQAAEEADAAMAVLQQSEAELLIEIRFKED